MTTARVGVSDTGRRCGETHHRAKLSDHDIDLIRDLHSEGIGYRRIAEKFEVSHSTVRDIVKCRRRYAVAIRWKLVTVPGDDKSRINEKGRLHDNPHT